MSRLGRVPGDKPSAVVDPSISRAKFAREIDKFRSMASVHAPRGIWLVEATFPNAFVVFGNARTSPHTVMFGALFNFDDYDMVPPSVVLVNPFTREPYTERTFPKPPFPMQRGKEVPPPPEIVAQFAVQGVSIRGGIQPVDLLQRYSLDDVPFLCLSGVREYHAHPGHSGDSWLTHRTTEAGSLNTLVNTLYRYGVEPFPSLQMAFQVQFVQGNLPE